jgi:hypothetical protein
LEGTRVTLYINARSASGVEPIWEHHIPWYLLIQTTNVLSSQLGVVGAVW